MLAVAMPKQRLLLQLCGWIATQVVVWLTQHAVKGGNVMELNV